MRFLLLFLFEFLFGFYELQAHDTAFIVSKSHFESKGLKNCLATSTNPDYKWELFYSVNQPFQINHFRYTYKNIHIQNCKATVGLNADKVFISATLPEESNFANCIALQENQNPIWIYNAASNIYKLYAWNINAEKNKEFENICEPTDHFMLDERRYFGKDTNAPAFVFRPDPLSKANVLYGGNWRDRHDSSNAELESQQVGVTLPCSWWNDSFRLENQWLSFGQISSPTTPAAVSQNNFYFKRNQWQFEEVNVFYHICNEQRWWDSLGFSAWKDTVVLDAHGYFGADESAYNPLTNPPTIEFGDGGVDDAEDADAAVHEYTHAAFEAMIPSGYIGTQRQAVEEGICDFMALCYSRKWTLNQAGWVYNWDGHNEFWGGRNLDNNRKYPGSLTHQAHVDGQLFGGALYDLANEIGDDSTLKLVLASIPFLMPGISMKRAAEIFIKTDSFMNVGKTNWPLVKAFYPRGLLPSLNQTSTTKGTKIRIKNSEAFTKGIGNLFILGFSADKWQLYNANGSIIREIESNGSWQELPTQDFKSGVYFITNHGVTYKIVKF